MVWIWDTVFKNGLSKICGRQPLKYLKGYANFTWSILEYFVPMIQLSSDIKNAHIEKG